MKEVIEKIFNHIGFFRNYTRQDEMYPNVPFDSNIKKALALDIDNVNYPINIQFLEHLKFDGFTDLPNSKDIFSLNGEMLPCWLDSDIDLEDDWLTANTCYPLYFHILKTIAIDKRNLKILEIGVRTGYFGVVCVKAIECGLLYVGIDPNIYIAKGLDFASQSFHALKNERYNFDYFLINGYSNDPYVQSSLKYSGEFDIIHIDGDHSLKGKLNDLYIASKIIKKDGLILVDDYDYIACVVQSAIKRALELKWFTKLGYIPTKRGLGILQL